MTDLNVSDLDIYHTWVGDLVVTLESPSGKTVKLFDQPGVPASSFGCPEDNLFLNFDDDATENYETLDMTCNEGNLAISGIFQPFESLKVFNGEMAKGVWKLTICDMAEEDGGTLNGWDLDVCSTITPDLSITSSVSTPSFCLGENIAFQITLGTGFDSTGINLTASGNPIGSTVSFSENNVLPGTTVEVTVQGLNSSGNFPILLIADDGINTFSSEFVMEIKDTPPEPHLMFPLNGQTGISITPTLFWIQSQNTTDYLVEIAEDEEFINVVASNLQQDLEFAAPELDDGRTYFWRVSGINDCGATPSPVFSFTTDVVDAVTTLSHDEITIFPNPTNGKLIIKLPQPIYTQPIIEFYSSKGQFIKRFSSNNYTNEIEVDLSEFPDGIYLLRVVNDETVLSRKVIIQK